MKILSFPKSHRLLKGREIRNVLDQGKKRVFSGVLLFALNSEHSSRLGLIVTKKVGCAVIRNTMKRRVREIFRCHVLHEEIRAKDWVVIVRKGSHRLHFSELQHQILTGVRRMSRGEESSCSSS